MPFFSSREALPFVNFLFYFMCFKAIECGRLPGDILDDIPCKYVDGIIVCEVSLF